MIPSKFHKISWMARKALYEINNWHSYNKMSFLSLLLSALSALLAVLGIIGATMYIVDPSFYTCIFILGVVSIADALTILALATIRLKLGDPR